MATQAEIGLHLDLSDRSVRDLISRGVLPQSPRKALDLDACRIAYIRHLRETAAGRAAGDHLGEAAGPQRSVGLPGLLTRCRLPEWARPDAGRGVRSS